MYALKLPANWQVELLFEGFQERSRIKTMKALRKFIMIDNHEAVTVGDLQKYQVALRVVGSSFNEEEFPEVSEVADELALCRGEEGVQRTFMDTTNVGDHRLVATAGR